MSLAEDARMSQVGYFLRSFHGSRVEYVNYLQMSLRSFYPGMHPGQLTVVLDKGTQDATYASFLAEQWPFPSVQFHTYDAELPVEAAKQGEYFFADKYMRNDTSFVAMVDSDTLFISSVVERSLFDESGRPYIIAQVGNPQDGQKYPFWVDIPKVTAAILGRPCFLRGMSYFPVTVKPQHLRAPRARK